MTDHDILCKCRSWKEHYFILTVIVIIQYHFRILKKTKKRITFSSVLQLAADDIRKVKKQTDRQKEKDITPWA